MGDWQSGARELLHTERLVGAISAGSFFSFWLKANLRLIKNICVLKFFAEFEK